MKLAELVQALLDKFPENLPQLKALPDADLLEVAGALAARTSGIISLGAGHVLHEVPLEIQRRGPTITPLLEREADRLASEPSPPSDLPALIIAPLALLLAASGKVLDARFDPVLAPSIGRRTAGIRDALRTLPMARRLALVRPHLHAGHGRSSTPYELLDVCPDPEVVRWTASMVAGWKRDRDEMNKMWACDRLLPVTRAFAAETLPELLEALGEDLGPYRAPFVRALGAAADGSAIPALVASLGDRKADVIEAASEALVELHARLPSEVMAALEPAAKGRGAKAKVAATVIAALQKSRSPGTPADPAALPPSERLAQMRLALPRDRVDAVLKFYQDAPYSAPFAWENLKGDEPALLVGLLEWGKDFFPIQYSVGNDAWINRRWRDPFQYLGREESSVRDLAPWAAVEAFGHIRREKVTGEILNAFDHAFGAAGLKPLAEALRKGKLAGRQHLLEHLYLSAPSQNLDLFLEAAADKTQAVASVARQIVAGFGPSDVPALIALLKVDRKAVRTGAAAALERAAQASQSPEERRSIQAALAGISQPSR